VKYYNFERLAPTGRINITIQKIQLELKNIR
jgi:hypothetical protein